jgi:hypothetical protein
MARTMADMGFTWLPDRPLTTYTDPLSESSIDCWVLPNTLPWNVDVGVSTAAQHFPLELTTHLDFPEGLGLF